MNEKVTVIIPVYKVEQYLNRCMESVVNQTFQNLEIILVDDGSPDNCPQMCDEWTEKDERIRVVHKANAGVGMARNSGLEIATGDYLMFVDSDDYLSENAVEVLFEQLKKDGSDIAVGKHIDVIEGGDIDDAACKQMAKGILRRQDILVALGEKGSFSETSWAKLYKKEIFENTRFSALTCGEDVELLPRVIENCNQLTIVDETIYFYFRRKGSITQERTLKRRKDDIKASSILARYIYEQGHTKGALRWLDIAVEKAKKMEMKTDEGIEIIEDTLSAVRVKQLLNNVKIRKRIMWRILHYPLLFHWVSNARANLEKRD